MSGGNLIKEGFALSEAFLVKAAKKGVKNSYKLMLT